VDTLWSGSGRANFIQPIKMPTVIHRKKQGMSTMHQRAGESDGQHHNDNCTNLPLPEWQRLCSRATIMAKIEIMKALLFNADRRRLS
jgi:hypothetical protein